MRIELSKAASRLEVLLAVVVSYPGQIYSTMLDLIFVGQGFCQPPLEHSISQSHSRDGKMRMVGAKQRKVTVGNKRCALNRQRFRERGIEESLSI